MRIQTKGREGERGDSKIMPLNETIVAQPLYVALVPYILKQRITYNFLTAPPLV